jgi:hypothetical protein
MRLRLIRRPELRESLLSARTGLIRPGLPTGMSSEAAGSPLSVYLSGVIVGRLLIGKTGRIIQLFLPNQQATPVSRSRTYPNRGQNRAACFDHPAVVT